MSDSRWSQRDWGTLFSGVFRGLQMACVWLSPGEWAATAGTGIACGWQWICFFSSWSRFSNSGPGEYPCLEKATLWHVRYSLGTGSLRSSIWRSSRRRGAAPRARLSRCKPAPGSKKCQTRVPLCKFQRAISSLLIATYILVYQIIVVFLTRRKLGPCKLGRRQNGAARASFSACSELFVVKTKHTYWFSSSEVLYRVKTSPALERSPMGPFVRHSFRWTD